MTITVTYNKRKYEWDKNRAMNGLPAWKSDKGRLVHSKRLNRKLEMRARRESKARREAPREHTLNRFDPAQAEIENAKREGNSMTPLEKFKASHKVLTNYHDILEGGHERALDSYELGEVKALHIYDGGLHIEEMVTKPPLFHCCVERDHRIAETRSELEPMLYEFWLENVHDA